MKKMNIEEKLKKQERKFEIMQQKKRKETPVKDSGNDYKYPICHRKFEAQGITGYVKVCTKNSGRTE